MNAAARRRQRKGNNMDFYKRVSAVQAALKAPKGQTSSFGGYKYRSCEDILEAVKPLLKENDLVLNISDDITLIGDRYYIKATATLHDAAGDQTISNTAFAREPSAKKGMDEPQVTGTASSYARKYALNGLFCIDDTKDPDTDEYRKQTDRPIANALCEGCGREISPVRKRDGEIWEVDDIVAYSSRRFGRPLCPDCQKAALKAER